MVGLSIVITILLNDIPSIKRPQEPTKPYAYYSEDVKFHNNGEMPSAHIEQGRSFFKEIS